MQTSSIIPNYALGKQNSVQSFVKSFESLRGEKTTKVKEGLHKGKEFLMYNLGLYIF